ncbi:unnamed protein product, partial [Effrenium voratum]
LAEAIERVLRSTAEGVRQAGGPGQEGGLRQRVYPAPLGGDGGAAWRGHCGPQDDRGERFRVQEHDR